jgi:hypothetical protein
MIYMLVILMLVRYRHDISALISKRKTKYAPMEIYGGLDYEPTIEQDRQLRRIK